MPLAVVIDHLIGHNHEQRLQHLRHDSQRREEQAGAQTESHDAHQENVGNQNRRSLKSF